MLIDDIELIYNQSTSIHSNNENSIEISRSYQQLKIKYSKNSPLEVNLFDLLKTYSTIIMTKDFQRMNIPKLPVFTTEDGIKTIRDFFGNLMDWKNINDLIPVSFKSGSKYKRTGKAGIFAGSLELAKEGDLSIKQEKLFDDIYVKEVSD